MLVQRVYNKDKWVALGKQSQDKDTCWKIEVKKIVNHAVVRKGMLGKRISVAVSYYQWK